MQLTAVNGWSDPECLCCQVPDLHVLHTGRRDRSANTAVVEKRTNAIQGAKSCHTVSQLKARNVHVQSLVN